MNGISSSDDYISDILHDINLISSNLEKIGDFTDKLNITSANQGDILKFDGTNFVPSAAAVSSGTQDVPIFATAKSDPTDVANVTANEYYTYTSWNTSTDTVSNISTSSGLPFKIQVSGYYSIYLTLGVKLINPEDGDVFESRIVKSNSTVTDEILAKTLSSISNISETKNFQYINTIVLLDVDDEIKVQVKSNKSFDGYESTQLSIIKID
jgi:hypothetical protein